MASPVPFLDIISDDERAADEQRYCHLQEIFTKASRRHLKKNHLGKEQTRQFAIVASESWVELARTTLYNRYNSKKAKESLSLNDALMPNPSDVNRIDLRAMKRNLDAECVNIDTDFLVIMREVAQEMLKEGDVIDLPFRMTLTKNKAGLGYTITRDNQRDDSKPKIRP